MVQAAPDGTAEKAERTDGGRLPVCLFLVFATSNIAGLAPIIPVLPLGVERYLNRLSRSL